MDLARTVTLEVTHHDRRGHIELTFGEWDGSSIPIAFSDRLFHNSGIIQFDGSTGHCVIQPSHPYLGPLSESQEFNAFFGSMLNTFIRPYTFGSSPEPSAMVAYDEEYHRSNNYIQGDPNEIAIKRVQSRIIAQLAAPRKCVIAGCSNGELVRQCREIGMDASGFDVIPNIHEIAFPEIREYVRCGSLTEIPFSPDDAFDTLVAIDVLEHIPERDVPFMVKEWRRIGVRQLVLLINLNQFWFPGHITLRPLSWWSSCFQPHFRLDATVSRFPHLDATYSNIGAYNQQWTLFRTV
jgi:hypothetical protein